MSWLGATSENAVTGGYLIGTAIFGVLLVALVVGQIRARSFNAWLYWATIVASTTCGTTLADFADRSLGIGYPGGSLLLVGAAYSRRCSAWYRTLGTVDVNTVSSPPQETFYWITITFSQTLGTALGDWAADARAEGGWGLGYGGGALVFGAGLAVLGDPLFHEQRIPRVPVLGGLHPHPPARRDGRRLPRQAARQGRPRMEPPDRFGRARAVIVALILILPQRAGRHPGQAQA